MGEMGEGEGEGNWNGKVNRCALTSILSQGQRKEEKHDWVYHEANAYFILLTSCSS
jgi:hypothetical protein